jgi:hypothetical protein
MGKLYDLLNTLIGKVNSSIKTTAQTLTDTEKAQARKNIGAAAEGEGGGGSSVQTDWDQADETAPDFLKNKPFGDVPGDTLNWDGTWNANELVGEIFIHISDAVPTVDDVANGGLFDFGESIEIPGEEIQSFFAEDGFCNLDLLFVVIPQDNYAADLGDGWLVTFPKAGVYSFIELPYLTITIPGYSGFVATKKMNEKYLPDIGWVEQTVVYVDIDADGVARIYKNEERTEMLTQVELFGLITARKRVVVRTSQTTQSYALYLSCDNNCIVYTTYSDKTVYHNIAYVAEYTP